MTGSIRGLHVVSEQDIWISGTNGEYSVTRDGGESWVHQVVKGAEKLDFRDVYGFSGEVALLMSIGPGVLSKIFRTENAGNDWKMVYENPDSLAFFDGIEFFNSTEGLIISDPIDPKPYLLQTKDSGLTWRRHFPTSIPDLQPGEYVFAASGTSMDANEDGRIWLATGGSAGRIFYSSDFGNNWQVYSTPILQGSPPTGIFSVAKGPGTKVAICGGNYRDVFSSGRNIGLSGDSGKSWIIPDGAQKVPFMECIRWLSESTILAAGPPGIWISSDSGKSWREVSKEGFHTFDAIFNKGLVWLAGDGGKVLKLTIPSLN